MKKLNLNETWKLCLSMWRWMAEQRRKGNTLCVYMLKRQWLQKHDFEENSVYNDCFFCEYAERKNDDDDCPDCPGKKVDQIFCCMDDNYHFYFKPIAFYNKLRALNRKRTKK